MCDPTFMLIAQGAGTGLAAFGAYQSSAAKKQSGLYNAAVNRNRAADAMTRGEREASRHRLRTKQLKGSQIAAMAANGVSLDEGTALDILAGTDVLSSVDEATIISNAEREAQGYTRQSSLDTYLADAESPLIAGVTPLLTGGAQVSRQWYNFLTVDH